MASSTRPWTAALFTLLIISTTPIEAKRVLGSMKRMAELHDPEMEAIFLQLKHTLDTDEAHAAAASNGRSQRAARGRRRTSGWYCDKLQRDYERRAGKLERALKEGHELPGGAKSMSWAQQGYAALKSRTVVKTLRSGQYWECEWAMQNTADKTALSSILSIAASENPCVKKAGDILKQAQGLPEAELRDAVGRAFLMMMADAETCTPPKADGDDGNEDADALEKVVDDEAAQLERQMQGSGGSFLQTGNFDVVDYASLRTALLTRRTAVFAMFLMGAMAVMAGLVLFIACWGGLIVGTLVVGFAFCILRSLIYGLIWTFSLGNMGNWDYSFGGCVKSLWRFVVPVEEVEGDSAKPGTGTRLFGVGCAAASIGVVSGAITVPAIR